jgi:hypothetical protein
LNTENLKDNELLERWYRYASRQAGFVGHALNKVRHLTGQTEEEQRLELGADPDHFVHLCGMPLPRAQYLIPDANRIAEECRLIDSLAFVRTMILAHKIENSNSSSVDQSFYQAAFDAQDDLDSYPEEG